MKKIPTLFRRDPENMRRVLPEVTSGCEWVLAGEGIATRKFNGTCVMLDGERWWARREVKPGKPAPTDFVAVEKDESTGKTVGWTSILDSPFVKFWSEVVERLTVERQRGGLVSGTYELCGPKINGNPEGYTVHVLIRHATAERLTAVPRDFDGLAVWLAETDFEGIVWHHPDGRMAKLKRRDFA
jgi:hypothetical protein